MIEIIILYILLNKEHYNKYYKYITINNKELLKIYHSLPSMHEGVVEDASVDLLETSFYTQFPFLKEVEKESYRIIFSKMRQVVIPEGKLVALLEKQREGVLARRIAELALDVSEGRKDFSEILDHVSSLDVEVPEEEEVEFVTDNLATLHEKQVTTRGLRWRLGCLNKSLGSLRKGDFGFVFARPETGKTTFLASECTFMASQGLENPILWFNNEEQGEKVMLRCMQASLGATMQELFADIANNQRKFEENTNHNIKIIDSANIHRHFVETLCKKYSPSLIIFDQIDKIKGFDADRTDLELGAIYQWARELAKEYAPVIGVCQADGTGEGVKYLTMGHVSNAKTAKQAEADWILGIGKSNNEGEEYTRYFNISKNKLIGDDDTMPDLRHGHLYTIFKPHIARYEDGI